MSVSFDYVVIACIETTRRCCKSSTELLGSRTFGFRGDGARVLGILGFGKPFKGDIGLAVLFMFRRLYACDLGSVKVARKRNYDEDELIRCGLESSGLQAFLAKGVWGCNVGASRIRIGFWGRLL